MPLRWSNDSKHVWFCTQSERLRPVQQPNLTCRKCKAAQPLPIKEDVDKVLAIGRAFADAHRHEEER